MFKPFLIVSAALGLAACMPSKQSETGPETCPKSQFTSLIGTDIYEKLVKGYTEKQWGRPCSELPAFIR